MQKINSIKKLLEKGDTIRAIDELIAFMEEYSFSQRKILDDYYNEAILLKGRFTTLNKKIRFGIVSPENENIERNQINYFLLEVINKIPTNLKVGFANRESELTSRVKEISDRNKFKYDLFLSFSHKDIITATNLWERLTGYGFKVFFSSEFFKNKVGTSFNEEIANALENSKSFILIWSLNSKLSKWVTIERKTFFNEIYDNNRNRNFYIFQPNDINNIKLPMLLRFLQRTQNPKRLVKSIIEIEGEFTKIDCIREEDRQAEIKEQKRIEEKNRQVEIKERKRIEEKNRQAEIKKQKRIEEKNRQVEIKEQKCIEEKNRQVEIKEQKRIEEENVQKETTEDEFWKKAKIFDSPSYRDYYLKFPNGKYVKQAKRKENQGMIVVWFSIVPSILLAIYFFSEYHWVIIIIVTIVLYLFIGGVLLNLLDKL